MARIHTENITEHGLTERVNVEQTYEEVRQLMRDADFIEVTEQPPYSEDNRQTLINVDQIIRVTPDKDRGDDDE